MKNSNEKSTTQKKRNSLFTHLKRRNNKTNPIPTTRQVNSKELNKRFSNFEMSHVEL